MKKNITILSIFIFIFISNLNLYCNTNLFSANSTVYIEFCKNKAMIQNIYSDMVNKNKDINEIELGFIQNNKFYYIKDYIKEIDYIKGTNIIKITALKEGIKFEINIYTPFDANKESFFITTDIITEEIKSNTNIKLVYNIKSDKTGNVYWNKWSKLYSFNKLNLKSIVNDSDIFITNNQKKFDNKLLKSKGSIKKKINNDISIVVNKGNLESYNSIREILMISFSTIDREFVNNLPTHYILNQEISHWNYWHNKSDKNDLYKNDELLIKQITILKMLQINNEKILSHSIPNSSTYDVESTLYTTYALIKTGHYNEAKKIILKLLDEKNINLMKNNNDDNLGLFLLVFSEYLNESKDFTIFNENYFSIQENILEYIYEKYNNSELIITKNELKKLYYISKGIKSLLEKTSYLISKEVVLDYLQITCKINNSINKFNEYSYKDIIIVDKDIVSEDKIELINKTYFQKYLKSLETKDDKEIFTENLLDTAIALYNCDKVEEFNLITNYIDDIIYKNSMLIPNSFCIKNKDIAIKDDKIRAINLSKYIIIKNVGVINANNK